MTTISPNYAGVNFRATEQVQPKKAETTNVQPKTDESKGMSNAMKAGIGLAALSVAVIGGLAAKKHIDVKKLNEFVTMFKANQGEFKNIGKEVTYESIAEYAARMKDEGAKSLFALRLNKQRLGVLRQDEKFAEQLLGAETGVHLIPLDENNKPLGKGCTLVGKMLDEDVIGIFKGDLNVRVF